MSLREERLRKAAERQRGYRRRRKELEEAEAAAIAKGEPFERPPKGPKGHHLAPYQYATGHEPANKGSRQRLSHDFILAFHQHFLERGHKVFDELLANEPATYARLLASLVAKQVEVHANIASGFSDEYVLGLVQSLDKWLAEHPESGEGAAVLPALPEAEDVP